MSEPCFDALYKFLTRHQKNGLRLRGRSTAFEKLINWIAVNSNKESAAIKALEAVSNSTIVFAISKKGSNPLSSLWDFLDARIQIESKKQIRERSDFHPNMRVSPTAWHNGSHHMKPGHS
jgi:hypothetical protein